MRACYNWLFTLFTNNNNNNSNNNNNNNHELIRTVRAFEKRSAEKGHSSLVKNATRYVQELGTSLRLESPEPSCSLEDSAAEACTGHRVKLHLKKAKEGKLKEKIKTRNGREVYKRKDGKMRNWTRKGVLRG